MVDSSGTVVITTSQLNDYYKKAKDNAVDASWNEIIQMIPDEELRKEAKEKGFKLVDNPFIEDDGLAKYMIFQVPNASKKLQDYLEKKFLKYVICIKE